MEILTRTGEILEGLGGWAAFALPIAFGLYRALRGTDPQVLRAVLPRAGKLLAGALAGAAVAKGWITPDAQDATTAKLAEIFTEIFLLVAGAWWVHGEARRELTTVQEQQERTRIALKLPANATLEQVEAIRRRVREGSNDKL